MGHRIRYFLLIFTAAAAFFAAALAWADAYDPPASYYSSATGTGATLMSQLRTIISVMDPVSYDDARYSAPYTDADPNVPGNILLIYNRASVNGAWSTSPLIWNREHIWPDSRLGTASDSDQFNLRPANPTINSTRGNDPFGLDSTTGSHGAVGDYYYPGDADAGDVARSQFYMPTRYSTLSLTNATLPPTGGTQMGDLSSLITYHFRDVPDAFERRRNHAIYGFAGAGGPAITNPYRQENRNPFVDHPEWVWSIFETTPNNSQIAISGSASGATRVVDMGRIFVNDPVPAAQNFTLNKSNQDGTYFEVTTAGAATSTITGRLNAFRDNQTDSKPITVGLSPATSTATAGLMTGIGTVTVDNLDITNTVGSGQGSGDANDVFRIDLTVLDHARPSFVGGMEVTSLMYDFGTLDLNDPAPTFGFNAFNYDTPSIFPADLDFDSVQSAGDTSALSVDFEGAPGSLKLLPGIGEGFTATFDTSTLGEFSATYTLMFSDEDLPGALNKSISLTLVGMIEQSLLFGDYNRDNIVDAADYTLWRNTLGEDVAEDYDGADGDGDSMINEGDYVVWMQHYGEFVPEPGGGGLASPSVPEPASWLLAVIALAAIGLRRRT